MAKPSGRRNKGNGPGAAGGTSAGGLPSALLYGGLLVALLAAGAAWWLQQRPRAPPQVTPLRAPLMKDLPELSDHKYKNDMSEAGPLLGLMWFDPASTDNPMNLRHDAQQGDRLERHGWLAHDGKTYGRQLIEDGEVHMNITMVKVPGAPGAGYGGDWVVRVEARAKAPPEDMRVVPLEDIPVEQLSLIVYIADGRLGGAKMEAVPGGHKKRLKEGLVMASGTDDQIGDWALHLRPGPGGSAAAQARAAAARTAYTALPIQQEAHLVGIKDLARNLLMEGTKRVGYKRVKMHSVLQDDPGLTLSQISFEVGAEAATTVDIAFLSNPKGEGAEQRLAAITGPALTKLIQRRENAFNRCFDKVFRPKPVGDHPAAWVEVVSRAALSNLIGSMGYFVGESLVRLPPGVAPAPDRVKASAFDQGSGTWVTPNWRAALYTATPSRSFFPRGFLWDEGFHQLLIQKWDPRISRDALAHWLDLMNSEGWIPREQILGEEARARVPAEFVVQHPDHANPPSLMLPLALMARAAAGAGAAEGAGEGAGDAAGAAKATAEAEAARQWLERAWPRLEVWYSWFNRTQAGQLPGSYRWHGRDASTDLELNPKTLTSGLDDYPRASHPTDDERHVDLLCWMALASRTMAEVGAAAGAPPARVRAYAAAAEALGSLGHLKGLHWDEGRGMFLDYGLHSEGVALERQTERQQDGSEKAVFKRVVVDPPTRQLVPAFGYVSLFPFLAALLPPDCPELGRTLDLIINEDLTWTDQGLRSLARSSSIYKKRNTEHDPPYWRGQIWININYLALRALHHYSTMPGPHADKAADAYRRLRTALLSNLLGQYYATSYLWEQYDDVTGDGISSHPFTGWTALLTLAAAEVY